MIEMHAFGFKLIATQCFHDDHGLRHCHFIAIGLLAQWQNIYKVNASQMTIIFNSDWRRCVN